MKTYFASFCVFLILTLTNKVQSQHLNTSGTFLDKKGGLFVATIEKEKSDLVSIKVKKYLLNKKTNITTSVVASDYNLDVLGPVKILETSNGTLYVVFLTKPVVHANPNPFKMSDDVSSKNNTDNAPRSKRAEPQGNMVINFRQLRYAYSSNGGKTWSESKAIENLDAYSATHTDLFELKEFSRNRLEIKGVKRLIKDEKDVVFNVVIDNK
ncbi:sialidase family protein [Flectobacillus longus]|uniref:sialidase family protein n=1 Tax=Flectobacillus longus TaxID=2984207 RepID=UPI0024B6EC95|nr:sialidase family protein [Flectobacillus longus]MDI9879110.1 sialidase family protein [Flectobacillus longus]